MKYFFCKLIPPRATLAQDMTPAERALMDQHVANWQDLMDRQKALVFGPAQILKAATASGSLPRAMTPRWKPFATTTQ